MEEDLSDADTPDTFSRSSDSFDFGLTNGEAAQVLQCSAAFKSEVVVMEGNEQSPKVRDMDRQSTDSGKDCKKPRRDIGDSMVNGNGEDAIHQVPEVNGNFDGDHTVPALPASQEVKSLVENILSSALEEATLGIRNEIQKLSPSTSIIVNPLPESSEIPEDLLCNFNPEDGEILEILQPHIASTDSKVDQTKEGELQKPVPPPHRTLARDFPKLPLVDNLFTVNLVDDIISSAIDEAVHNPPPFECEDVSDLVFLGQSTLEDREGSQERADFKEASPAGSDTIPREPVERTLVTEILFVSETSFMDDLPEEKEIQEDDKTDETSEQVPGSPSVQLNPDAPVFVPSFLKENETESEDGSPQKREPETPTEEEEESPISDSPDTVISPSAIHDEDTSVTSTEEIIGSPESKRTLNLDVEKDLLTAEVAAELSALDEILDSEMKGITDLSSEESNEESSQKPASQSSTTNDLLTDVKHLLHEEYVTTSEPATPQPLSKSDETTLSPENAQSTVSNDESVVSSVEFPESEISVRPVESLPEKNIKKPADIMQTLEDAIQKSLDDLPHSEETKKLCSVDKEEFMDAHSPETIEKPTDSQQADDSQIDSAIENSLNSNKDMDILGSILLDDNLDTKSLNISENRIFQSQSVPSNPENPGISSLVDVSSVPEKQEVKLLDLEEVDLSSNLKSSFQEQENYGSEQQASESLDTTQDVFTKEISISKESSQAPEESGNETTSIGSEIWQKELDGSSLSNFLPVDGKISPALISLESDPAPPTPTHKSDVTDHPLSQKPQDILDDEDAELEGDFDYVGEKYMTESQEFYDPTKFKNYYQICSSVDVPDSPRDQAIVALQSQTPPISPQAQSPLVAKVKTSEKGRKVNVPMDNLQPRTSEIVVHESDDLSECGSEDIETIGHRYEASEAHRHLYVNRLSLAAELLGTRQDLPYDDEFKPLVDSEGTVIAAPPPTPASPFTGAEAHSNRHIYDSYYGSRDPPTSPTTAGSVAVGPLRSSGGREVSDSGVQSEESGDDADDETKQKAKRDKNGKSDDEQDVFDKSRVTGFSYKQFGGGRRPISSVLKGKTDPLCLCCNIM